MDKFIKDLARKAGMVLKDRFGKAHTVRIKANVTDVVTEADLAANRLIVSAIRKSFPDHGIVSEETGNHQDRADYLWYIDPLDGTFNFSQGIPIFCVMLGLAYQGRLRLSVVYDPMLERFYFAKQGVGAFLNDRRIQCASKKGLKDSYGCFPSNMRSREKVAFLKRLISLAERNTFWLSAAGSAGIQAGYVASGALDWWASLRGGPWDYAACALLLQEAGCVVTTKQGNPWRPGDLSLVAANKNLHPQLLRIVQAK